MDDDALKKFIEGVNDDILDLQDRITSQEKKGKTTMLLAGGAIAFCAIEGVMLATAMKAVRDVAEHQAGMAKALTQIGTYLQGSIAPQAMPMGPVPVPPTDGDVAPPVNGPASTASDATAAALSDMGTVDRLEPDLEE